MSEERIVITVQENGSRVVSRNLRSIGEGASSSEAAVRSLKTALASLGGLLAINQIKEFADTYVRSASLVNIFTQSQTETNVAMGKLFDIAQRTRQGLEQTVKTYHQMAIAGSVLNASQTDMLAVTELVQKAFAIQGTSSQLAKAGIIQLSHSFTEGLVRGRQFNALLIDAPRILQVAANNIDAAGGSIGKLRQLMLAGQLTSKMFFDALKKGANDLDPLFDRTQKTFSQAFTVLKNALIMYSGELNKASGFSDAFFKIMKWGADNVDILAKSLLAIASPLILSGLLAVGSALKGIAIAAALNPFTAILAGLIAATTAAILFKDQIILNQDEQLTLGDYMTALAGVMRDVFGRVGPQQVNVFQASLNGLNNFLDVTINKLRDFNVATGGVAEAVNPNENDFNRYGAFQRLLDQKIGIENRLAEINNKPSFIKAFMGGETEQLTSRLNNTISLMARAQDSEKARLQGKDPHRSDDPGAGGSGAGMFDDLKKDLTARAKLKHDSRLKETAQELKDNAAAAELLKKSLGKGGPDDFAHTDSNKGKKGRLIGLDNPATLEREYRALLKQIHPMAGVTAEYAHAEDILNREQAAGTITAEKKAKLLELVKNYYRDIKDPIGKYVRDLQRENDMMKLNTDQRQVAEKMYSIEEGLQNKGIFLTEKQTAAIQAQVIANQELNKIMQIQDGLRAGGTGEQLKTTGRNITASGNLLKDKSSGFSATDAFNAANKDLGGKLDDTSGGLAAKLDAEKQFQKKLAMYRKAGTIDAKTEDQAQFQSYARMQALKLQTTSNLLGAIAQLSSSHNKKLAAIGKAAAIAQSVINTYQGATMALAQGGIYGVILAAVVVAAGLAEVAKIKSTPTGGGFKQGGYTGNGGVDQVAGNVHGREYVMDAATTARIGVSNLDAMRAGQAAPGANGGGQPAAPAVPQSIRIINVPHDQAIGDYMASDKGEQVIINTLKRNSDLVRSLA